MKVVIEEMDGTRMAVKAESIEVDGVKLCTILGRVSALESSVSRLRAQVDANEVKTAEAVNALAESVDNSNNAVVRMAGGAK